MFGRDMSIVAWEGSRSFLIHIPSGFDFTPYDGKLARWGPRVAETASVCRFSK